MNDDKTNPLPCPFCSSDDVEIQRGETAGFVKVICINCLSRTAEWTDEKFALEAWNRRPIAQEVREEEKYEPARVHRYAEYFERMTKAESKLSALTKERDTFKTYMVDVLGVKESNLNLVKALTQENKELKEALEWVSGEFNSVSKEGIYYYANDGIRETVSFNTPLEAIQSAQSMERNKEGEV